MSLPALARERPRWSEVLRCTCERRTILIERQDGCYLVYHGKRRLVIRGGEVAHAKCDACNTTWDLQT